VQSAVYNSSAQAPFSACAKFISLFLQLAIPLKIPFGSPQPQAHWGEPTRDKKAAVYQGLGLQEGEVLLHVCLFCCGVLQGCCTLQLQVRTSDRNTLQDLGGRALAAKLELGYAESRRLRSVKPCRSRNSRCECMPCSGHVHVEYPLLEVRGLADSINLPQCKRSLVLPFACLVFQQMGPLLSL